MAACLAQDSAGPPAGKVPEEGWHRCYLLRQRSGTTGIVHEFLEEMQDVFVVPL
jgi:hypothetical protein